MSPEPERLVLLGHPLGHSLSPTIQNAALRAAGIPLLYVPWDVPSSAFDDAVDTLRSTRSAGNVTIPYKERFLDACDRVTAVGKAVGAVNTFWIAVDGALVGDNTDVDGFQAAVIALLGTLPENGRIALIGAGGGAAAVLRAVEGWDGATVRLYSRTRGRAERLAARFRTPTTVVESAAAAARDATLLINATPLGLRGDAMPIDIEALPSGCAVLDLAYAPDETALVRAARTAGHAALDGMTMLVEQGAAAFERWFGEQPDRDVMWGALRTLP